MARTCRECGCTDARACTRLRPSGEGEPFLEEGAKVLERCSWVNTDLCTACVPSAGEGWQHPHACICTEGDDPSDHRKAWPQWRYDGRAEERLVLDGIELGAGEEYSVDPDQALWTGVNLRFSDDTSWRQGRTAAQLIRDTIERFAGPKLIDLLWPVDTPTSAEAIRDIEADLGEVSLMPAREGWGDLRLTYATTAKGAIEAGRTFLENWRLTEGEEYPYQLWVDYEGPDGHHHLVDPRTGYHAGGVIPETGLFTLLAGTSLLPVGGVWDGPATEDPETEEAPMHAGMDANERERDAERSAPHGEAGKPPAGERIDGATEIPHTREQAERARTQRRDDLATPALRRILSLLLSTAQFTCKFEMEGGRKAMKLVGLIGSEQPGLEIGDTIVTWEDTEAIKDLLEGLVTNQAMRGAVGNVAFHPEDLRDALRRLDRIAGLAAGAYSGKPSSKRRYQEALATIRNLAKGATDPPASDEDSARIENVALRSEVDRLRRVQGDLQSDAEAQADHLKNQCDSLAADLDRMAQHLGAASERNEALERHADTLVRHLAGSQPAWWAEAGEALVRLRELINRDGAGAPQTPPRPRHLDGEPGRRGGRVH